ARLEFRMRMTPKQNLASGRDGDHGSLVVLAVLALIVGAVSGFVGALFLLLLERADRFRDAVIVWAHSKAFAGSIRAPRCDGGAWRIGDRHLRLPCAPRRCSRLPRWGFGLCWRCNQAALLRPRGGRRAYGHCLQSLAAWNDCDDRSTRPVACR